MSEHILFLGPPGSALPGWLRSQGHIVTAHEGKLTPRQLDELDASFLVSYGYRYILDQPTLDRFPDRAVNLHISLLPWNRGADPNFWSFLEGTPKGVSVHFLDAGIDTGDIIAQAEVSFDVERETLATSYALLQRRIQALFRSTWPDLHLHRYSRTQQSGPGTSHRMKDKEPYLHLLTAGWDTPVSVLEEYGQRFGLRVE